MPARSLALPWDADMTTDNEKVLDKVRKLLALANNEAASEGERDNAMRMAHKLLTMHQLEMAYVDAHTRDRDDPRGRTDWEGWNMPWCKNIRSTVGKLFMCQYIIGGKINATRGRHIYVGRASNVATAMYMSDFIIRSLLREGTKRFGHNLAPETRAFATGASDRLYARVSEMQKQAQQEVKAAGSSLVLADLALVEQDANEAWKLANMSTTQTKPKSRKNIDVSAYLEGTEYGSTIGLNTQLANKPGTLAIGSK